MSDTTADTEPDIIPADAELELTTDDPTYTLADLTRTVAFADAVEKAIKDRVIETRKRVLDEIMALRASTGLQKVDVLLTPGDPKSKVATISLNTAEDKIVVANPDAYTGWVQANYPDEVEYIARVRDSFADGHVKSLIHEDGDVYDPKLRVLNEETGEVTNDGVVDGVRFVEATAPKSFRLTFERESKKHTDGRLRTLQHLAGPNHADGITVGELLASDSPVIDG